LPPAGVGTPRDSAPPPPSEQTIQIAPQTRYGVLRRVLLPRARLRDGAGWAVDGAFE
jgi:hypothetical protein